MAYSEQLWQESKRKFRLNTADIELVKKLGINPKSLMKNGTKKRVLYGGNPPYKTQ